MPFISRLSVAKKLQLLVGLLSALLVAVAGYALLQVRAIGGELQEVATEDLPLSEALAGVRRAQLGHALEAAIAMRRLADDRDVNGRSVEAEAARVAGLLEEAQELGTAALASAASEESRRGYNAILAELDELSGDYGRFVREVDRILHGGDLSGGARLIEEETALIGTRIESLEDRVKAFSAASMAAASQRQTSTVATLLSLLAVALAIGIGGGLLISRGITRPLGRINSLLADIADGEADLSRRLTVEGKDEIAALAESFNRFMSRQQKLIADAQESARQLAAAAEELTATAKETREAVANQKNEADQVATAANQMSAAASQVASNAAVTNNATQSANSAATEGRRVVGKTIESINLLAEQVELAAARMRKLEADSRSVVGVLDVIRAIAEQTNLLALNAAIEAARAGDTGRGFAVVAGEVRTLAAKTQGSIKEIHETIARLQENTAGAVDVMKQGQEQANTSISTAAEAGAAIESMMGEIDKITTMNSEVASASEEQSMVTEEINRRILNISGLTEQTATAVSQVDAASAELARLAAHLDGLVGSFKA